MVDSPLRLELLATDPGSAARRGILHTPHGAVQLPAFMPVGTQATVKGCTIDMLRATGAEMVLGNAYHLAVRPGADVIEELGGLHRFMGWDGPILTDSGGFQVFSLERLCRVTDEAVEFRSHVDGRLITLSPERVVQIQESLGSDVAMVLDHVVALPSEPAAIEDACRRTVAWAARSRAAARRPDSGTVCDRAGRVGSRPASLVCRAAGGAGFSRLRGGRSECRRDSGRDVCGLGCHLPAASGAPAAVLDGGGAAGGYLAGDRPRHRFV